MNDAILDAQLKALRMKPNPYLPSPCMLPPWLICATLKLEYVVGGTYFQRGSGRAFSFGALFKDLMTYTGNDDINAERVVAVAEMRHEEEQRRGLYPVYEEINLDGTPLTPTQKKQREAELARA